LRVRFGCVFDSDRLIVKDVFDHTSLLTLLPF
jgi:hypothetical protein